MNRSGRRQVNDADNDEVNAHENGDDLPDLLYRLRRVGEWGRLTL